MNKRRGITIIEVLVAIALCLFACGLVVMFIARNRENGQRAQCSNNLRKIGLAIRAYHGNEDDKSPRLYLPPSRIADGYATWAVLIVPSMFNEHPLIDWDVQKPYLAQAAKVREARVVPYFCPARPREDTLSCAGDVDRANVHLAGGLGDYAAVAGNGARDCDWTGPDANGAMILANVLEQADGRITSWKSRTRLADLKRGEQYTFLVGEKHVPTDQLGAAKAGDGSLYNGAHPASFSRVAGPGFPLAPSIDAPFSNNFGSFHNRVCHFLMADGSFRSMTLETSEFVLGEMAKRGE